MDISNLVGITLGNYKIERLLGKGGMCAVYKARQLSLDRPVALKILPPSLSSDSLFLKRFQREARAVAKLNHPNIIKIHDISESEGLHFFSMEYVEGQTFEKVLSDKGFLKPNDAIRIISEVAIAVDHAHANKITHRDIKPSNIMVS